MAASRDLDGSDLTVLLPVKDGAQWLESTLSSVSNQTLRNFQVLIVDDHSLDDSMRVCHDWDFTNKAIISGPNKGLAAALTLGVSHIETTFIARHDQDDLSDPRRLELQLRYMRLDESVGVLGSWAGIIGPTGEQLGNLRPPTTSEAIKMNLTLGCPFVHGSTMLRRSVVQTAGGYFSPDSSAYPEDLDLWIRMSNYSNMANLPRRLLKYRVSNRGISSRNHAQLLELSQELCHRQLRNWIGPQYASQSNQAHKWLLHVPVQNNEVGRFAPIKLLIRIRLKAGISLARRGISKRQWLKAMWFAVSPKGLRK